MSKSIWDTIGQVALAPANLVGDALDKIPVVGPYIAPTALTLTGNPELAAAYQGIHTGMKTGNALQGLEAGAGTYAGNAIGSSLGADLGNYTGGLLNETPANALGNEFGGQALSDAGAGFGTFAGNVLGSATLGSSLGGVAGSTLGASMGQPSQASLDMGSGPAAFSPSQQSPMGLPQSLSQFGNLNPQQQATNIASKGVYGGGNGPQEQNYFLNLINRQLFDQGGNVAANTNNLAPVDMSYLNQLGISGSSPTDYLKGISQFGT